MPATLVSTPLYVTYGSDKHKSWLRQVGIAENQLNVDDYLYLTYKTSTGYGSLQHTG